MSQTELIYPRWVIPVEPRGRVLTDHVIAVRDGEILAIMPQSEVDTALSGFKRIDLPEHVLIPGLVNLHTHAAMTLLRGLADDLPLMRWLQEHIWPAEAKHVSEAFVRDGTLLACAEMLRGGVTCANDMYFFPAAATDAARAGAMRLALGMIVIDFPTAYATDAEDYLAKGLALRDAYREHPLLSFCLAPHAPYTVSDRAFKKIAVIANELDLPIHVHVHETTDEVERSVAEHGVRPIERLQQLGLIGPGLIAVHAVHLSPQEIELLAKHGASVAHCPSSNLKLASGFAPVAALQRAGVNVGLGTDGAASNNRLDSFEEMRTAALLAKAVSGDAQAVPAAVALEMATLNGARALGLSHKIGSITPGKRADLTAVRLAGPGFTPCFDPLSMLVYCAGRDQVTDVWVDGQRQVIDGVLQNTLFQDVDARAKLWQNQLKIESETQKIQ